MEICKAPTLRLKALKKHTYIMYIEMENVIKKKRKKKKYISTSVKRNYAKDARTHTHSCMQAHTHTHTLYRLIGVKDSVV